MKELLCAAALLAGLGAAPAAAQVQVDMGMDVVSSYTSRGITWTNRPVLQPYAGLTLEGVAAKGALELWANVEPGAYDGAGELTALNGTPGVTELNVAVQFAERLGRAEIGVGVIAFVYPRPGDFDPGPNTIELLARATLDAPLAPEVTVYYDAIAAPGIYAQLALEHELPRLRGLTLEGALGVSWGQADAHDASSYYAADGLTHAEVGATLPIAAGPVVLQPSLRGVFGIDRAARRVAPGSESGAKLVVGVGVGWMR